MHAFFFVSVVHVIITHQWHDIRSVHCRACLWISRIYIYIYIYIWVMQSDHLDLPCPTFDRNVSPDHSAWSSFQELWRGSKDWWMRRIVRLATNLDINDRMRRRRIWVWPEMQCLYAQSSLFYHRFCMSECCTWYLHARNHSNPKPKSRREKMNAVTRYPWLKSKTCSSFATTHSWPFWRCVFCTQRFCQRER